MTDKSPVTDYLQALMKWTLDGSDPTKAERLNELWQAINLKDRQLLTRRELGWKPPRT